MQQLSGCGDLLRLGLRQHPQGKGSNGESWGSSGLSTLGDRSVEGNPPRQLGNAYGDLGEPRRAIELYEQILAIAREIGDRRGEGRARQPGQRLRGSRRAAPRHRVYEQGLLSPARSATAAARVMPSATWATPTVSRRAAARHRVHEQDLTIAREIGDRRGEGNALGNLGNAYTDLASRAAPSSLRTAPRHRPRDRRSRRRSQSQLEPGRGL